MKRRLLIIAIFLLLGAVVNVAVAWGLAIRPVDHPLSASQRYVRREPLTTNLTVRPGELVISQVNGRVIADYFPGYAPTRVDERAYRSLVPSWSAFFDRDPVLEYAHLHPRVDWFFTERAAGWPCLSLRGTRADGIRDQQISSISSGLITWKRLPKPGTARGAIPLLPIWPGFALNTLVYAAILWLAFLGPFALRRFLRVRRGLCPKCAYPMGESAVCTECGIALPKPFGYPRTVQ